MKHAYVVGDFADLPYAPSAQVAEEQAEQIVKVLRLVWNNEPLPKKCQKLSSKASWAHLGKKQGFAYLADRTVTGRIARLLKIRCVMDV